MTKSRFMKAGALAALATALLATSLPATAQEGRGGNRGARAERSERSSHNDGNRSWSARRDSAPAVVRSQGSSDTGRSFRGPSARAEVRGNVAQPARNPTYTAPRDRSYGMAGRGGGWQGQNGTAQAAPRPAPAVAAQARSSSNRPAAWNRDRDGRGDDARRADWQRSRDGRGDDARRADWQRSRTEQARQAERRDDRRNYANGYRDGRRDDNRWGNDHRRWDSRGWRNDNRYDWYRYRAGNRSLFSLGRYYSPYRGYTYSRLNIGFRLGSLFYSNRYWINDPWQYRLPPAYGGYRWVRYYDDALLVDTYSGEVVDVIYDFFW